MRQVSSKKVTGVILPIIALLASPVLPVKIIKSIIKDVAINYLLDNNLLTNCQFGFVNGRSVQLQLLSLLNHWTDILDSGHTIDVIYLDFKKAFDSVLHIRLLSKLHSYGFRDPLLGWTKSSLIGRRQRVCVHDTVSSWHNITSGIPQGSVLGPVLFLLYINDLRDTVASNVYMFADNAKIYRLMTSHEDTTILQNDLDCLQSWSAKWLLNFNLHKCKVISITKSTACSILPSLTDLFNSSLASGIFPQCFKSALVTPILKKRCLDHNDLNNYRPVYNLCFD